MNSSKSLSPSLLSRCLNTGRIQVQAPVSSRKKLFEAMACLLRNGIVGDVKEKEALLCHMHARIKPMKRLSP